MPEDAPQFPPWRLVAAAAVGGALGALTRYAVEELLPTAPGGWPWATFTVNLAGAFVLGLLTGWLTTRHAHGREPARWLRPLVISGYLGGLTTFSTYMVETFRLLAGDSPGEGLLGLGYLFGSVLLGVVVLLAGMELTDRSWPPPVDLDIAAAEEA